MVCTLIDNDIRHDRGQNVVDSRVQPTEFVTYWSLRNKTSDLRIPRSHTLPIGGLARGREGHSRTARAAKTADKKLGRERRRIVLKSDLAFVVTRIFTITFNFSVL